MVSCGVKCGLATSLSLFLVRNSLENTKTEKIKKKGKVGGEGEIE